MSFLINHYRNRTRDYDVQLFESDGTTEVLLAAQDKVLVHIYRVGVYPEIEIRSDETEGGGSKVTFTAATNDVVLRLAQGDTNVGDLETGAWDCDVIVIDASDKLDGEDADADQVEAAKHVETGVLFIHPSSTGAIDEEQSSSSGSSQS
jgi:hypothetical protein